MTIKDERRKQAGRPKAPPASEVSPDQAPAPKDATPAPKGAAPAPQGAENGKTASESAELDTAAGKRPARQSASRGTAAGKPAAGKPAPRGSANGKPAGKPAAGENSAAKPASGGTAPATGGTAAGKPPARGKAATGASGKGAARGSAAGKPAANSSGGAVAGKPAARGTAAGKPAAPPAAEPAPRPIPPRTVRTAVLLMYAGAALTAVGLALSVIAVATGEKALRNSHPNATVAQLHATQHVLITVAVASGVIEIAAWLLLARANRGGLKWARIAATVLFALSTANLAGHLHGSATIGNTIYSVAIWLVGAATIVFLWLRQSSVYFRS